MTITGGLLFGGWLGAPATVIAATIGATIIFLDRQDQSSAQRCAERAGPWLDRLRGGFEKEGAQLHAVPAAGSVSRSSSSISRRRCLACRCGPSWSARSSASSRRRLPSPSWARRSTVVVEAKAAYDACVAAKGAASCHLTDRTEQCCRSRKILDRLDADRPRCPHPRRPQEMERAPCSGLTPPPVAKPVVRRLQPRVAPAPDRARRSIARPLHHRRGLRRLVAGRCGGAARHEGRADREAQDGRRLPELRLRALEGADRGRAAART